MAESSVVTETISSADKLVKKIDDPGHENQDDTKAGGQIDAAATEHDKDNLDRVASDASHLASPPPPPPPPPSAPQPNFYPMPPPPPPLPILQKWTGEMPLRNSEESMKDYLKRKHTCEVVRNSMQVYKDSLWHDLHWPMPILQAFYQEAPETRTNDSNYKTKDAGLNGKEDSLYQGGEGWQDLQRIIIWSDILLRELASMISVLPGSPPIVMAPPFKFICQILPHITARIAQLKGEINESSSESPSGIPSDSSESISTPVNHENKPAGPSNDSMASKRLSQHDAVRDQRETIQERCSQLEYFNEFIKKELRDIIELRESVKSGKQEKISFKDLWHLFEPKDIICSRRHYEREQLYRVFAATGGQTLKSKNGLHSPPFMSAGGEDPEEDNDGMHNKETDAGVGTWTPFKIDCYKMAFDGVYCGPVDVCKTIRPYAGEREITSLPVYPIQYHPKKETLLEFMEERGRKVLFGRGHRSYENRSITLQARGDMQEQIESDVYVDFEAYFQDFPEWKPVFGSMLRSRPNMCEYEETLTVKFDNWGMQPTPRTLNGNEVDLKRCEDFLAENQIYLEKFEAIENSVHREHLILLPPWVVGYVFQTRRWHHLDVEHVKEMDRESLAARKAGFDDLVIDQRYRDLLVALVDSHASGLQREEEKSKQGSTGTKRTQIDLVRGKGQGLIILLHGPPGSGKTSTAETIAAYTGRPLYAITCGDIGITPEEVENRLFMHTRRADRWGCVLLLDEADVFLVQRDWHNIQRNALVSVFLRELEYYAGILFLTTNRPGVLDEAFKSRIHISLRYPSIDLEATKAMWRNIMNRLANENKSAAIKILFDKEGLLEFSQRHYEKCQKEGVTWNGRQIRNAFQTAIALGHYERTAKIRAENMTPEEALATGKKKWNTVKLTKANFQKIARTASDFEEYIGNLRGNDSTNARDMELRDDEYDPSIPRARKQYSKPVVVRDGMQIGQRKDKGRSSKQKIPVREEHSTDEEDEDEDDEESEDLSVDSNEED